MEHLLTLSNPLVTVDQLRTSSSQLDGLSAGLEASVRLAGVQLTQAAGILLRLPQEVIAQAIVVFTRFYTGPEGGSFLFNAAKVRPLPAMSISKTLNIYLLMRATRMYLQPLCTRLRKAQRCLNLLVHF